MVAREVGSKGTKEQCQLLVCHFQLRGKKGGEREKKKRKKGKKKKGGRERKERRGEGEKEESEIWESKYGERPREIERGGQ